jgi:hypothetical protein
MKTITASITDFSRIGAETVKKDIELATGKGTATLVTHEYRKHTITVSVVESKVDTVISIFRSWNFTVSEPQPEDQN